jgi:hypothetical protein
MVLSYLPDRRMAMPLPNAWRGKTILIDLDGTLIQSRKLADSGVYTLARVRDAAPDVLPALRRENARCFITSAAESAYIESMMESAGIMGSVDGIFSREDLGVQTYLDGETVCYMPKDYSKPITHAGEDDPLGNCAIIGNDPDLDVPRNPLGIVTLIGTLETSLSLMVAALGAIVNFGDGRIAAGFDRLWENGISLDGAELIRTGSWRFWPGAYGLARIVRFDTDRVHFWSHMEDGAACASGSR